MGTSVARRPLTPRNYAARAKPSYAKLSFAFTLVCCALADGIARPSHRWLPHLFSTYRIIPCRTYSPPSKTHSSTCNQPDLPECVFGGGGGNRTRVQSNFKFASSNQLFIIHQIR